MKKAGMKTALIPTLIAIALGIVLLFSNSLAQMPKEMTGVPESRRHMGINLPPYRMDLEDVPIDDQIVDDLANLGVKWMRFEFKEKNGEIPVADYQLVLDRLQARDIEVLGLIDYTTVPAPREQWGTCQRPRCLISLWSN